MRYLFTGILSLFFLLALDVAKQLKKRGNYAALIPLMVIVLLFTGRELFSNVPLQNEKKAKYERVTETLEENGLHYGYTTHRSLKVLELLSHGNVRDSLINFDNNSGRFSVSRDRIYTYEALKPGQILKFFIVRDPVYDSVVNLTGQGIELLEQSCEDKLQIDNILIYIFSISDWDKVLSE